MAGKGLFCRGHDRHDELVTCKLAEDALFLLKSLVTRRGQLARYAKEEKQRLSGPLPEKLRFMIEASLEQLQEQLGAIEQEIAACIKSNAELAKKAELMQELPGVGPQTAAFLLAEMPELGQIDRKAIASLAGLAPHAYDSGKMNGRRTTWGGRRQVKAALFLAALNAVRSRENALRTFYERLLEAGKSKRCALVAVARKLVTILNARLKEKFYIQPDLMSR